ncbi:Molybdopterin synthase sulfur carrier subunit [Sinobacterium norvegicum]|uniref:Molybdopterin synthase sulfur carrier subunit n=1 Tax=Sinobacterium norvegicum TaxID=1641715 RepID=A0ABM9AC35_9GAMM|nr:molybdopterin converting factor subunit 1 [Sinobacterium norvegicum]CAH0990183.1 Molybdopterin synthase sulfur carrier subunit [Sinobacterium norvegicum]
MVTVLFFAKVREDLDCRQLQWPLAESCSVAQLKQQLVDQHGGRWSAVLGADNIICAVNQQVVDHHHPVLQGDEVAFYPPVTGG